MAIYYYRHGDTVQQINLKKAKGAFEADNPELVLLRENELTQDDRDVLEAAENEVQRKRRRDKILEIADLNKQLQMVFDNFAHLQMQVEGLSNSEEVNSFIGKRNAIKDEDLNE